MPHQIKDIEHRNHTLGKYCRITKTESGWWLKTTVLRDEGDKTTNGPLWDETAYQMILSWMSVSEPLWEVVVNK